MGLDSNTFPLERFAAADLLIYQNKLNEANALLDSLYTAFPFHSLSDEILYAKARIARKQHQFELALGYLDKIISIYGEDILADNALFDSGQIEELNLNDKEKAKAFYEKLITNYPGSLFTVEARKRFRSLRGDLRPTPGQ
jgi:outer membrane protein assembly factor BamD (BamD/ComL family)